jgi:5'-nucleotidase
MPYKVFTFGELKVGVTGVGIELDGLVPKNLYQETRYLDPVDEATKAADHLKLKEGCDYVVCLSHLGYRYRHGKVSDIDLAEKSRNIDLILGGHTHTFLDEPDILENTEGRPVVINQVGWGGMKLGRIEVFFEKNRGKHCTTCTGHWVA